MTFFVELLFVLCAYSEVTRHVCLSAIVRNEEKVIARFLDNNRWAFDHFDITDTGSTDRTVEIIEEFAASGRVSATVHSFPWIDDFGAARSYALERSRETQCSHYVFLDADDEVWSEEKRPLEQRERSAFHSYMRSHCTSVCNTQTIVANGHMWWRLFAVSDSTPAKFIGARHETLNTTGGSHNLEHYFVFAHRDQTRLNREPHALLADAFALERDILRGVNVERAMYYAGQSYEQGGDSGRAIAMYQRRVDAEGGWDQERYVSQLHIGMLTERQESFDAATVAYFRALALDESRAEAYFYLARGFRTARNYVACFLIAREGARKRLRAGHLFADADIYEFSVKDEAAVCASYLPDYRVDALELFTALSVVRPSDTRVRDNLAWLNRTLALAFAQRTLRGRAPRSRLQRLWKSANGGILAKHEWEINER